MTKNSQLRAYKKAIQKTQEKRYKGYFAVLGTLIGEVLTAIPNLVYITTFEGQTRTVINRRVPNRAGSVVFIGSDDYSANRIEILYTLNITGATNDGVNTGESNIIPPHDHSYPGENTTWVYDGQIMPLNVLPVPGTLTVQIYPGTIRKRNSEGWKHIEAQSLDFTNDMPASGACWITLQANDDGIVDYVVGATQASRNVLDETDIPETTTGRAIFAIILEAGYTELFRDNARNDFLDLRFDRDGGNVTEEIVIGKYREFVTVADGSGGWEFASVGDEPVTVLKDLE